MVRRILRLLSILGFVRFGATARNSYHFLPSNVSLQDGLNDDTRRETLINSLILVKDDRTILSTILDPTFAPERDVSFRLFTRDNVDEPYILKLDDSESLQTSPFKSDRITKIIIHGWTDSANSYWVKDMTKNYLAAEDYNVISVDWYAGSVKEYFVAARLTRQVGDYLGEFIEYLRTEGNLSHPDVHILGHSLGAHIAGYAGTMVSSKIGRITGLDPARPAFEVPVLRGQRDRLDPGDASFVDVIHSCAGTAGFVRAIGHVDFYPNGGSFRQPGCSVLVSQYCSHGRSHEFMTESISAAKDFVAVKCESWTEYKTGKCEGNTMATMGEHAKDEARGKYFLETNAEAPFAQGIPGVDFENS